MLGLIAVIAIQRAIHKILIAVFLSREFKHDETNRAWWTGRWYGRGLGTHAMSQPAREFVVKIIELSLWSSDLLLGHFLLFMLTPAVFIPYMDRFHATLLCKRSFLSAVLEVSPSFSLVASVEADPSAPVFCQTEAAAQMDCESRSPGTRETPAHFLLQIIKYSILYVAAVAVFAAVIALRKFLNISIFLSTHLLIFSGDLRIHQHEMLAV